MKSNRVFFVMIFSMLVASSSFADLRGRLGQHDFQVERVISGLKVPWGMTFLTGERLLITERSGRLLLYTFQDQSLTPISGLPPVVEPHGQGGLLDVAVPPNDRTGNVVYLTYSTRVSGAVETAFASANLRKTTLVDFKQLYVSNSGSETGRHFGSRIAFDQQGYLYFSVGDRGERETAQDLSNAAGSIMRLRRNGEVPKDNPFHHDAKAHPAIWSFGHRNPQGLTYDPVTQRLWTIEHGPRGGDEINLVKPGLNYGWPVISYGKEYWGPIQVGEGTHREGMEQPVKYYVPSIAPSSLIVYRGAAFPHWQGRLFSGALKGTHLNVVTLDEESLTAASEDRLLESLNERIRNVIEGPEGWIYFSTDSGKIFRIKSSG